MGRCQNILLAFKSSPDVQPFFHKYRRVRNVPNRLIHSQSMVNSDPVLQVFMVLHPAHCKDYLHTTMPATLLSPFFLGNTQPLVCFLSQLVISCYITFRTHLRHRQNGRAAPFSSSSILRTRGHRQSALLARFVCCAPRISRVVRGNLSDCRK